MPDAVIQEQTAAVPVPVAGDPHRKKALVKDRKQEALCRASDYELKAALADAQAKELARCTPDEIEAELETRGVAIPAVPARD